MHVNADLIKSTRESVPWSQSELAIAAGLSLRTVQRVERDNVASLDTIRAIAAALNLAAKDLIISNGPEFNAKATGAELKSIANGSTNDRGKFYRKHQTYFAMLGALVVIAITTYYIIGNNSDHNTNDFTQSSITDRLQGSWAAVHKGLRLVFTFADGQISAAGDGYGVFPYDLRGDVINYRFRNTVITCAVSFVEAVDMLWTCTENDYQLRWKSVDALLPDQPVALQQILGSWQDQETQQSLHLSAAKLQLTADDDIFSVPLEAGYLFQNGAIQYNVDRQPQYFVVNLSQADKMIWSDVFSDNTRTYNRINTSNQPE